MDLLLKKRFIVLYVLLVIAFCSTNVNSESNTDTKTNFLVDADATLETINLYYNLRKNLSDGVLFGQHDALAYGIGWKSEPDQSDIKKVVGEHPAVHGWDLGDIHKTGNLDGVSFDKMKQWIKDVYQNGGINTISMHLDNPVTGGNAWDNRKAVEYILPGGPTHQNYLNTLDQIAAFLKDLKTDEGIFIPIVFRPYHEHNQSWSWWSTANCTKEEFISLWKMTVHYLRDTHDIHHLIYAISPQDVNTEVAYLNRFPGDNYVDVLGLDYYKLYDISNVGSFGTALNMITSLAEKKDKISALTEVGLHDPYSDWWTNYLLAGFQYSQQAKKIAWSLIWRNKSTSHHFGPYPGHRSEDDFISFYNDSLTHFQNDVPQLYQGLKSGKILSFSVSLDTLQPGQRTILKWQTVPGSQIFLNGSEVAEDDSLTIHPTKTNEYRLTTTGEITDTCTISIYVLSISEVNRAIAQPIYASSYFNDFIPSLAVDGDPLTGWVSAWSDTQWIELDLGEVLNIERILLNWDNSGYAKHYTIYSSNDSINWVDIYSTATGQSGIHDIHDINHDGRFIRVSGTKRSSISGYSLLEFEVYSNTVSGIESKVYNKPKDFILHQNYPNPFNPSTTISYSLSKQSNVELSIFNLLGEEIATLVSSDQHAGNYSYKWDASRFSSGIYFASLRAGASRQIKRMLYIK